MLESRNEFEFKTVISKTIIVAPIVLAALLAVLTLLGCSPYYEDEWMLSKSDLFHEGSGVDRIELVSKSDDSYEFKGTYERGEESGQLHIKFSKRSGGMFQGNFRVTYKIQNEEGGTETEGSVNFNLLLRQDSPGCFTGFSGDEIHEIWKVEIYTKGTKCFQ